ncbi:MAG: dTDP-4-dehydrorhamnose 3,5-epimerase [Flavobacterium sp. BFFFF2]|nr:MAG: dTDP-4-dehydrorhamnose 3,5-epimerase [Flavobacterium sp. BFFFF2]
MTIIPTHLEGCFIIEPKVLRDERGYFMESYNAQTFARETGINIQFVQDNQSFSSRGVLRGLHYQAGDFAQTKLVRVIQGEVLDVAVDIRPNSATYGQHVAVNLSSENQRQLYIPKGFAHGYAVLSETAIFFYKCDTFYDRESEGGVKFDDPALGINWQLNPEEWLVSEKDLHQPLFANSRPAW